MELSGTVVDRGDRSARMGDRRQAMAIVSGGGCGEVAVHERHCSLSPFKRLDPRRGCDPRGVHHAWGCARGAGWVDLGSGRPRARGVGSGHRWRSRSSKAIGATIVVTASTGKVVGVPSPRRRSRRRLHQPRLRGRPRVHWRTRGRRRARRHRGKPLERNLGALATKGTIVQVGDGQRQRVVHARQDALQAGSPCRHRAARPLEENAISRQFGSEMLPLFDQGLLKPVIDRRFSIDEVVGAHRYMESSANVGRSCSNRSS